MHSQKKEKFYWRYNVKEKKKKFGFKTVVKKAKCWVFNPKFYNKSFIWIKERFLGKYHIKKP